MSDLHQCPRCGGRMRFSRIRRHATFEEKRRDCSCGHADKVHVRIVEELLSVIEVVKRSKREVRTRTLSSPKVKTTRDNQE